MPEDAPRARVRADAAVETLSFGAPSGGVPNNPRLPVILMRGAVDGTADEIRALYEANGWRRAWVWTVYDYQHFHPDAHEALTVAEGSADLQLGGPAGPVLTLNAGDAVFLPAGTGHCRVRATRDFAICGAYPPDQVDRDVIRAGDMNVDLAAERIAAVSRPDTDPIFGDDGPVVRLSAGESTHGA